jgi:hypothetical protein
MLNGPFAKVGIVKIVESLKVPQDIPVPNEPNHIPYPELLVNLPERRLRKSPNDPQPMRLIPPIPISNTYSWLNEQVRRQIGATIHPKAMKTSDPYRIRKPTATAKPRTTKSQAPAQTSTASGFQRTLQPTDLYNPHINPYLSIPQWQKNLYGLPPPTATTSQPQSNPIAYQASYSGRLNHVHTPLTEWTYPAANPGKISQTHSAGLNSSPAPLTSAIPLATGHLTMRSSTNQKPYNPTTI